MIYFLRRSDGLVKIGTTKNFSARLVELERQYGKLELLGWSEGMRREEQLLHKQFDSCQAKVDGLEWFHPIPDLLSYIDTFGVRTPPPLIFNRLVNVTPHTMYALRLARAKLTASNGKPYSFDDVIQDMLRAGCPDIVAQVDHYLK